MPSKREQVLVALLARLDAGLPAAVRRNEALPERVPAEGLVILRDGDPGEPDVTLNPRHRVLQPSGRARGAGHASARWQWRGRTGFLLEDIAAALAADPSLGGLAENLRLGPPETGTLAIEGAAPILTARLTLTVEYLVSDPLAA